MPAFSWNRVEISLSALQENYRNIRNLVGSDVKILAMVKSEAYGHGLIPAAKALATAGVSDFGVAEIEEGIQLREAGLKGNIIITLGSPALGFSEVVRHKLSPVVFDADEIEKLSAVAEKVQASVGVHLKIDVGMGRLGVLPEAAHSLIKVISRLGGVHLAGILSHFPMADVTASEATIEQYKRFQRLLAELVGLGAHGGITHIANSAALIRYPETHLHMVRPGIALYGCYPAQHEIFLRALPLQPVMSFKTNVIQVKEVPAGYGISYGHRFITPQPARMAILPVGYDDGYLRVLSNRAKVLIRGCRLPVVGTVCMNACVVDITGQPEIQAGDEVVLLGSQGDEKITADEISGWMETISYEVLCLFGKSNRRVYV